MNYLTNQHGSQNDEGLVIALSSYSLEELKEQEREILDRIEDLRKNEPSGKRKFAREQAAWFSLNHFYLDKLKAIRDAIVVKRKQFNNR